MIVRYLQRHCISYSSHIQHQASRSLASVSSLLLHKMTTHSPTIVNQTQHTIVVFQERGVLYNKQVLQPGEAVNITKIQTGSVLIPYRIHAAIGDERALPDRKASAKNLVSVAAIPTAFCAGALATAFSAGTLAGPAAALGPLVSGLVVRGVVIDAAAIAAGTVLASRAVTISELLVKKHPTNFMAKTGKLRAGKRVVVITGGVSEPINIDENVSNKEFKKLEISVFKEPTDTIKDKLEYYTPGLKSKEAATTDSTVPAIEAAQPSRTPNDAPKP